MAFEKKPNKGYLFQNKDRKSDNSPTTTGYLVLSKDLVKKMLERNDFEIKIAAWLDSEKKQHSISVDTWKFDQPAKDSSTTSTNVPEFTSDSIPV